MRGEHPVSSPGSRQNATQSVFERTGGIGVTKSRSGSTDQSDLLERFCGEVESSLPSTLSFGRRGTNLNSISLFHLGLDSPEPTLNLINSMHLEQCGQLTPCRREQRSSPHQYPCLYRPYCLLQGKSILSRRIAIPESHDRVSGSQELNHKSCGWWLPWSHLESSEANLSGPAGTLSLVKWQDS